MPKNLPHSTVEYLKFDPFFGGQKGRPSRMIALGVATSQHCNAVTGYYEPFLSHIEMTAPSAARFLALQSPKNIGQNERTALFTTKTEIQVKGIRQAILAILGYAQQRWISRLPMSPEIRQIVA